MTLCVFVVFKKDIIMRYARYLTLMVGIVLMFAFLSIWERHQQKEWELKEMEQVSSEITNPYYLTPSEELPYGDAEAYPNKRE